MDVIFLTSGEKGVHDMSPEIAGPLREAEARVASTILGLRNLEFWREPDGALEVSAELIAEIQTVVHPPGAAGGFRCSFTRVMHYGYSSA